MTSAAPVEMPEFELDLSAPVGASDDEHGREDTDRLLVEAQAVAWAKANAARYGGDPARVFIAGHSAGAQIAGLLGTDGRYLQRAGTPLSGTGMTRSAST